MRRTITECSARVVACALFFAPAFAHAQQAPAVERVNIEGAPNYFVRPSDTSEARPVTVYLHGICGTPVNGCPQFADGVADRSWLLCPRAPVACEGGGAAWNAGVRASEAMVNRLVHETSRLAPGAVDQSNPGVLIGFSQGAYAAERLLRASPGRWRGVVFIGGFIHATRAQLEARGVRRAVFAAGRYDMTRATLEETARRLQREGFPARFVDLGSVGHTYVPARNVAGWHDALAWLEESY